MTTTEEKTSTVPSMTTTRQITLQLSTTQEMNTTSKATTSSTATLITEKSSAQPATTSRTTSKTTSIASSSATSIACPAPIYPSAPCSRLFYMCSNTIVYPLVCLSFLLPFSILCEINFLNFSHLFNSTAFQD